MLLKCVTILIAILLSISAQAKTYKATEETFSCIKEFDINPAGNVAEQIIKQLYTTLANVKLIDRSNGIDKNESELSGDYLERAYLVNYHDKKLVHPHGVYAAIYVTQYGAKGTNELKGFVVNRVLLNNHRSADLLAEYGCGPLTYLESK